MNNQLPSIFIGSSTEAINIAREIELHLVKHSITTIWKDGIFEPGIGMLETLMSALDQFDFAAMVLFADDLIKSRGRKYVSPRDNVLFELGLFMGKLGRNRVFIVHESDANIKLPSDLAGINICTYQSRENMSAALSPACTQIIKAIQSLGFSDTRALRQLSRIEDQHRKLSQSQHDLESSIADILIATVLDTYEYITLLKIAGEEKNSSYMFSREGGQPLLEGLRNRGLIAEIQAMSVFKNKADREIQDIKQYFVITDRGKKLLEVINSRGLGNMLRKVPE